jgi:outer membrane protein assembly factor BamA
MLRVGVVLFALCCCHFLAGQQVFRLAIAPPDQPAFWQHLADFKPAATRHTADTATFVLPATTSIDSFCLKLLQHFRSDAYLTASIDALTRLPDSVIVARWWLGTRTRWLSLLPANEESAAMLEAMPVKYRLGAQVAMPYPAVLALQTQVLHYAENHGYPFARVRLDSLVQHPDGGISSLLRIDRNRFFAFKELRIVGDVQLPKNFLNQYVGLQNGTPYSREKVLRLRDQLQSLLFLETTANPTVSFTGSDATVNVFLQKKRASRFDFILGILPQTDAANSSVLLTGSLSAAFQNALNLGERLSIELERLRPETQKLDVQAGVPYLFGTAFGTDGRLGIFKRDSTWVDAQAELGVQYFFPEGNFLRFLWENKSASLQRVDTASVVRNRQLPANLDFKQSGFGLETSFTRLNYRFNPRKGWALSVKGIAGFNRVLRNNQIEALVDAEDPNFRFSTLYDSITSRATRFRLEGNGALYIPFFARATIKIGARAGGIFSNKAVFANEQYRLGGNKLLRGFDEESLQATRFVVATAECRLLIGQNSYLAAFADWGYLENLTDRTRVFLHPLGLGAGLNFETRAGIFGINVAVGRRDNGQPVNLRAAKFHLGYVSLF